MTQPTTTTKPVAASPIRVQLRNAEDFSRDPKRSVLYWGPEFSGKSHNLMSWQDAGPLLLIYYDTNIATVSGLIGPETIVIDNPTVQQWQSVIVPAIQKRDLSSLGSTDSERELLARIVTIGFDSVSNFAARYLQQLGGTDAHLEHDERRIFLNNMRSWFLLLVGARRPIRDGHPGWNVVCTVHENIRTDDQGRITEIGPKIEGQYRLELSPLFDTCLYCSAETYTIDATKGLKEVRHTCYSIPFDAHRKAADRIGGEGKRLKRLPPKLVGTYRSLTSAWGLPNTNATTTKGNEK